MHDQQVEEEAVILNMKRDVDQLATDNEFLIDDNRKLKNQLDEMEIRKKGKIDELEKRKDIQNETILQLEEE